MDALSGSNHTTYPHDITQSKPQKISDILRQIAQRIFNSPLLWALAGIATLAITTVVVVLGVLSPIPFAIIGIALGLSMLTPAAVNYNKLVFEVSLIRTVFAYYCQNQKWNHDIIQDKLTLGAIPLINITPIQEFKNKHITAVLTVLEPHEWEHANLYGIPAKRNDWNSAGIQQCIIEAPDFTPLSQDQIKRGVAFLKEILQEKMGHAYVHCKAGKGRSATIVICYLLQYSTVHGLPKFNIDEALAFAKSFRPVININPKQKKAIKTFYKEVNKKTA